MEGNLPKKIKWQETSDFGADGIKSKRLMRFSVEFKNSDTLVFTYMDKTYKDASATFKRKK
jgi:hypothetical protein